MGQAVIIRSMRPEEIDSVLTIFEYYREAVGIDDQRYDSDRVLATIKEFAIRSHLYFRIALENSRPIGIIGGFLSPDPVENEHTATIQFLFLVPGHDSDDNYCQLINEFHDWAKHSKAVAVRAIDIGNNPLRLQKIYAELDYTPIRISIMNKEIA